MENHINQEISDQMQKAMDDAAQASAVVMLGKHPIVISACQIAELFHHALAGNPHMDIAGMYHAGMYHEAGKAYAERLGLSERTGAILSAHMLKAKGII